MPTMEVDPDQMSGNTDNPEMFVYTRAGGGNRDDYAREIMGLQAHPLYVRDYDDPFDSTYATFVFRVPDEWVNDYNLLLEGIASDRVMKKDELSPAWSELMTRWHIEQSNVLPEGGVQVVKLGDTTGAIADND